MVFADISTLAHELHYTGDLILSGANTLTLTADKLNRLNEAFLLIVDNDDSVAPSGFQVITTNRSHVSIFQDLAFLHDFVQKVISLKITLASSVTTDDFNTADVRKFRILKKLEINRLSIRLVLGLECVLNTLETLVCHYCLNHVQDVLKVCNSANTPGLIWNVLQKAVFSYNGLESLDDSFKYAPYLQILDLSHNRLTNADQVALLPNLQCLNLSYNLLPSVPAFNKGATLSLSVLSLKFNVLEDLSGLSRLVNLKELDVSSNCLTMHTTVLQPMLQLRSLTLLCLDGNPLSYHNRHRMLTAQSLHSNIGTSSVKFVLNGVPLSKAERLVVGTLQPPTATTTSPPEPVVGVPVDNVPANNVPVNNVPANNVPVNNVPVATARSQPHAKRSGRVREALIADYQEEGDDEQSLLASLPSSLLETSTEHLETKKQIETLREKFGEENWLHSRGGSFVQDVLGLAPSVVDVTQAAAAASSSQHLAAASDSVVHQPVAPVGDQEAPGKEMLVSTDSLFSSKEMSAEPADSGDSHDEEDQEMDKHVYPVQRVDGANKDELFLVVTKSVIKEREISYGKTRERWTVASLNSCLLISNNPSVVQLNFDTIRRDRQERRYIMEDVDAQNLVVMLGTILDSRSLGAMHQTVFRCLNCSSQFSHETDSWSAQAKHHRVCPTCHSALVIEMDEVGEEGESGGSAMVKSPSHSSIGAVGLWAEGAWPLEVNAVVLCSEPPRDKRLYTSANARSSASLDVSPEWGAGTPGGVGHVVRRSDSDIEIISNPSQSSIEVLDDHGTPIRKRSEERQTVVPPAVADNKLHLLPLSLAGLTESSSSGSFTDSICTTYEGKGFSGAAVKAGGGGSAPSVDEKEATSAITDSGNGRSLQDQLDDQGDLTQDMANVEPGQTSEGLFGSLSTKLFGSSPVQVCASPPTPVLPVANQVEYSYKDYSQVDHRVKLHLHLRVFDEETEQLVLLAKGKVMHQTTCTWYPGYVVFSTHRVYVLKITGVEGDEPEQWLKSVESLSLKELLAVQALPCHQGICLVFKQGADARNAFMLLLQDRQRSVDLLTFIAGVQLVNVGLALEKIVAMKPRHVQVSGQDCTQIVIFNTCSVSSYMMNKELKLGTVCVTPNELMICKDLLWLFPQSITKVQAYRTQKMSNLLEVEVCERQLALHFLDELIEKDETWTLSLETVSSLQDVVGAIQVPWEELFLVPLQVNYTGASKSCN